MKEVQRETYSSKHISKKGSEINTQTLYLKELEKEEQTKPKASKRKLIKIRSEINERLKDRGKKLTKPRDSFSK